MKDFQAAIRKIPEERIFIIFTTFMPGPADGYPNQLIKTLPT